VADYALYFIEICHMSDLQRMVYASRATFAPSRQGGGIELEVARILMQSRRNNPRSGLVGALYYGDGCFFQCLEGEPGAIDELCARIAKDPRHRDMTVLGRHPIEARSFSVWAMKYVPNATVVQALMARHGRKEFDPHTFDDALTAAMIDLLRQGTDADLLQQDPSGQRAGGDCTTAASGRGRGTRLLLGSALVVVVAVVALLLFR
jgi:hypothetical protein